RVSRSLICLTALAFCAPSTRAAEPPALTSDQAALIADIEKRQPAIETMARDIWDNPELGYLETRTAKTLGDALSKAGFQVTTGVAGIPTALTATFGSGSPVIGILGEMDALPGKSQASVPVQQEIAGKVNNQGCGHNLFGPGSVAAAIAV